MTKFHIYQSVVLDVLQHLTGSVVLDADHITSPHWFSGIRCITPPHWGTGCCHFICPRLYLLCLHNGGGGPVVMGAELLWVCRPFELVPTSPFFPCLSFLILLVFFFLWFLLCLPIASWFVTMSYSGVSFYTGTLHILVCLLILAQFTYFCVSVYSQFSSLYTVINLSDVYFLLIWR